MKAIDVTDENIDIILSSQKPLLLDFSAEWYRPYRMMKSIIELIAPEVDGKAIIGKPDIDENQHSAARFGIRNFPTFLFLKDGKLIDQVVSAVPRFVLEQKNKGSAIITKAYGSLLVVGGFALALILSYYMNIRFDHKAVIAFLKSRLRSSLSS